MLENALLADRSRGADQLQAGELTHAHGLALAVSIGVKTAIFTRRPRNPTRLTYMAQGLADVRRLSPASQPFLIVTVSPRGPARAALGP
jgi:hypothetical protein